jgi:hypothetical protein
LKENGFTCIENALLKNNVNRIPCFPLIDAAFASTFSGISLGEVQRSPRSHAEALAVCMDGLPVDGVYINLTLGSRQGEKLNENMYFLDGFLRVAVPDTDVLSISGTDVSDLDDPHFDTAELFHPGML